MGKFEGILLATDWDGTFYQGKLFDENIKALKYYVAEGGKFTVCSGRYSGFLASFKDIVPFNTYTICYNGAYIVDLDNNDILYKGFCDEHLFDIVDDIIEAKLEYTTISIYNDKDNEPVTYTIDDFFQKKEEIKKEKIYKILFRAETTDAGTRGAQAANKMELYNYIAVRSWGLSLEILKRENAKGAAIRRLAEHIGSKLVVAVGDYENDLDMIEAADIGYAVGNAIDEVKKIADRITVNVEDSAIAHIIYDLERDIDNKVIIL
ncbi:MAG: HAD-IIB family hydrolase [Clostridia bacterium]|nr:HAD-IIB family hydrolase [Clostridia bacterium]